MKHKMTKAQILNSKETTDAVGVVYVDNTPSSWNSRIADEVKVVQHIAVKHNGVLTLTKCGRVLSYVSTATRLAQGAQDVFKLCPRCGAQKDFEDAMQAHQEAVRKDYEDYQNKLAAEREAVKVAWAKNQEFIASVWGSTPLMQDERGSFIIVEGARYSVEIEKERRR